MPNRLRAGLLVELTEEAGRQLELVTPTGTQTRTRLRDGLRQVRASTGGGAVYSVVEVAPFWVMDVGLIAWRSRKAQGRDPGQG